MTGALLDGWALYGSIAAVDTAIAFLGLEALVAVFTFVKILAGVGWHRFFFRVSAERAGDYGL